MMKKSNSLKKKLEIKQRRQKVLSLKVKNLTEIEIGETLDISQATVSRDLSYLNMEALHFTDKVTNKLFGLMYKNALDGIDQVIRELWLICHNSEHDRIKLFALSIVMQAYCNEIRIAAEGPVVIGVRKLIDKYEELKELAKKG